MYKKLSLPYSTMHELATHTHTYAHIIILLTCGCNFLEVRVSRAVHRARGGPIRPMLSYTKAAQNLQNCFAAANGWLNWPSCCWWRSNGLHGCQRLAGAGMLAKSCQGCQRLAGMDLRDLPCQTLLNDAHHANGYDLNPKKQIH